MRLALFWLSTLLVAFAKALWKKRPDGRSFAEELVIRSMRLALGRAVHWPASEQRKMLTLPSGRRSAQVGEEATTLGGVPAWCFAPQPAHEKAAILHFHGGGYVVGSALSNRPLLQRTTLSTSMSCWSVDYRLAPEDPHPAALDDARSAYQALLDDGVEPNSLVLMGESAGGGLILSLLISLRDEGAPLPAGAVLGSPLVELTDGAESFEKNAHVDLLVPDSVRAWSKWYAGDLPLDDPRVSPTRAGLEGLPPLLVCYSEKELFTDDIVAFVEKARGCGVHVDVETAPPGAPHAWYVAAQFPSAQSALKRIAEWILDKAQTPGPP
jgi:acetyl esterase/lipase